MNRPPISVVMSVYNAETFLKECIDSVLAQVFQDFEFIVVDDGSTDNSKDIIKNYTDSRIVLIENKHDYIRSLNIGMSTAQGEYIVKMDADDVMHPNRLELQYNFMKRNENIDVSGTFMKTFGLNENTVNCPTEHTAIARQMIFANVMLHPTIIMKRKLVSDFVAKDGIYQVYDKNYLYAEDYFLWIQLIMKGGAFANISEYLLSYRISNNQITRGKGLEMDKCCRNIQCVYLDFVIDSILSKDDSYRAILENALSLLESEKLTFLELKQIVYVIYARIIE